MILTVPDNRQQDGHDCGEAVIICVLGFHRVTASVRLATREYGTDPIQIESWFRNQSFRVVSGEMTVDDLRHYCDSKRPVIALVHWPEANDSHYVVVRGVSRGRIYFHDVETGPANMRSGDFEKAWKASGRIGTYRRWAICPWIEV